MKSGVYVAQRGAANLSIRPVRLLYQMLLPMTLVTLASGGAQPFKVSSREHKAIVKAICKPIKRAVKEKVSFQRTNIRVQKGWAWFEGDFRSLSGGVVGACGLLKKIRGQWRTLEWGFADDTTLPRARKRFPQAPAGIFPKLEAGK